MTEKTPTPKEFQILILGLANRLRDAYGDQYSVSLASDLLEQAAGHLANLKQEKGQ